MNEKKRRCMGWSYYDQEAIETMLEKTASQGWMLEKAGSIWWTFRKTEPRHLHFAVTYFPDASEFDPGPTDGQLTKEEFCGMDGWVLVTRWGAMQIFYNEQEDPVPLETDPMMQVENLSRSMRKNTLFPHLLLIGLGLLQLGMQFSAILRDPVETLSDGLRLCSIPLWIALILASLWEIGFYFWWRSRARRIAEEQGVFLPIRTGRLGSFMLILFALVMLLLMLYASRRMLFLVVIMAVWAVVVVPLFAHGLKRWMQRRGVSRIVNRTVCIAGTFLLVSGGLITVGAALIRGGGLPGGREPVGYYEYHGITWEVYDDPLPLEVEDLLETAGRWSKEARCQETPLLAYGAYSQNALLTERKDVPDLRYTVAELRAPFLYELVKNAALKEHQNEVHGEDVFYDTYVLIDDPAWDAREVYRLRWEDGYSNTYLVCWPDRIAEIRFDWEPTHAQREVTAERLRQSEIQTVHAG